MLTRAFYCISQLFAEFLTYTKLIESCSNKCVFIMVELRLCKLYRVYCIPVKFIRIYYLILE